MFRTNILSLTLFKYGFGLADRLLTIKVRTCGGIVKESTVTMGTDNYTVLLVS